MIELNKKTQQDFLNREWVQRLLDAGVDMSDAKYVIAKDLEFPWVGATDTDYIYYKDKVVGDDKWYKNVKHLLETIKIIKEDDHINWQTQILPTYTVSELLYKLHEYIYPTIGGKEFSGGLTMLKDAPFYVFYYKLKSKEYDKSKPYDEQLKEWNEDYIYAEFEYPIESLASLLIQCHKKDIGLKTKDTGNISDK